MNIFEYDLVIYPMKIWVAFGEADFSDEFCWEDGEPAITDIVKGANYEGNVLGTVVEIETKKPGVILHFKNKKSLSPEIVAHEACHAAKKVFEYIGADINPHEPFEYLLTYIVKCVLDAKKGGK